MKACATCNQRRGPYASATRLTKSSNDADVTQTDKPSHSQVSNSFRIGHILLQHVLLHSAKYYHLDFTILLSFNHTTSFMGEC